MDNRQFNIGDKVNVIHKIPCIIDTESTGVLRDGTRAEIIDIRETGEYIIQSDNRIGVTRLFNLEYSYPNGILDEIKDFRDACKWCDRHGYSNLCEELWILAQKEKASKELEAYLKLRVITTALNEGWMPTFKEGESRWAIMILDNKAEVVNPEESIDEFAFSNISYLMWFKSRELAVYAFNQFMDLYLNFSRKGNN